MNQEHQPRIQAVLIDFDGTLVDSLDVLRQVYFEFMASCEKQGTSEEFDQLNGPSLDEIVRRIATLHKLEVEFADLRGKYMNLLGQFYSRQVEPQPGALPLLSWLQSRELTTAMVTGAPGALVKEFLSARDWTRYFEDIISGDDVERSKPSPDIYLAALTRLGISADNAIAMEDSPNGVRSAIAAGLRVIGVSSHNSRALSEAGAQALVCDLVEARTLLESELLRLH